MMSRTTRKLPFRRGRRPLDLVVSLIFLCFISGVPFSATGYAAATNVKLGIRPLDQSGNFFELSMSPGETKTLRVALQNFGAQRIAARTFPADAYTIVNGGFGARLRSEPKTGTTLWMDYKEEVLQLAAGESVTRSFNVTVPPGTSPGDYITGLVMENEDPIKGEGGAVSLNQVQRQAIAVAITVPGPQTPKLMFGRASHSFVGERSVVAVALENSGNVRLRPRGELTITDESDDDIFEGRVSMDSFYARTSTALEVPLQSPLRPGRYEAILQLEDAERGFETTSRPLPFEVSGVPERNAATSPNVSEFAGPPLWLLLAGAALVLFALALGVMLGRRQRPRPGTE